MVTANDVSVNCHRVDKDDIAINDKLNKSVVFLTGAALDLICSHGKDGRYYYGKIYCVTSAQYGAVAESNGSLPPSV